MPNEKLKDEYAMKNLFIIPFLFLACTSTKQVQQTSASNIIIDTFFYQIIDGKTLVLQYPRTIQLDTNLVISNCWFGGDTIIMTAQKVYLLPRQKDFKFSKQINQIQ